MLTKLRTETDRMLSRRSQSRALIRVDSHFLPREFELGFIMMLICGSVSPSSFAFPATAWSIASIAYFPTWSRWRRPKLCETGDRFFSMQWALARAGKRGECILLIPSLPTLISGIRKINDDNGVHGFPGIWDRLWALLLERYPIEQKQVYLTGISAGGQGCWNQLYLHPDRYAAAIPLMAGEFLPG